MASLITSLMASDCPPHQVRRGPAAGGRPLGGRRERDTARELHRRAHKSRGRGLATLRPRAHRSECRRRRRRRRRRAGAVVAVVSGWLLLVVAMHELVAGNPQVLGELLRCMGARWLA